MRLRLRVAKENIYISHLEFMRAITRALRRSGLPLEYSQGYNPRVKISTGPALAIGVRSSFEYVDIMLKETIAPEKVIVELNNTLPQGISVLDALEVPLSSPSPGSRKCLISYRFSALPEACLKKIKEKSIEVMDYIREIGIFEDACEIIMEICPSGGLSPVKFLREVGGIGKEEMAKVKIEKIDFKEI